MSTIIIGGGLSGLALAETLERQGADYTLLEARDRFGGRIFSKNVDDAAFDLGPAWFWPGQPRIAHLIDRLGLTRFDQSAAGILTFEDERGQVHRGQGFASMEGSWRLKGGLGHLIEALVTRIPETKRRLNAAVTHVVHDGDAVTVTLTDGARLKAENVVVALPLRIAAQLTFEPALSPQSMSIMHATATWMAGQAKVVAVYERPFWREEGLSGDATSRIGPMVEVHDASPASGGPYALFGFIGVPPNARQDHDQLKTHIQAQLVRLFGPKAEAPLDLIIKDWAFDQFTATEADRQPLFSHPIYGMPAGLKGLWGGQLHFAGTEVAAQFGGYIEGALEAAEEVSSMLSTKEYTN